MALDPKLLIVGAALAFLLSSKKSSGKSTSVSDGKKDIPEEDKNDKGEPVGPNGCKTGLVEKDGYCVDPTDPNDNTNGTKGKTGGGGGGGGTNTKAELIMGKDCKTWSYGDKTGDAWWKAKGKPNAQQWIKSGYSEPLQIAYEMLKASSACFKSFPVREEFPNWFEYNVAKFEWINSNRPFWFLLYSVRNKIDLTQFNGVETVQSGSDLKLKFGPGFNYDKLWESLKPMALTLLQLIEEAGKNVQGPVAKVLGLKDSEDYSDRLVNIPTYLFTLIFPNIPVTEWVTKLNKGMLYNIPLWKQLQESVNEYDGESIDLEAEADKF